MICTATTLSCPPSITASASNARAISFHRLWPAVKPTKPRPDGYRITCRKSAIVGGDKRRCHVMWCVMRSAAAAARLYVHLHDRLAKTM